MKKVIILLLSAFILTACQSDDKAQVKEEDEKTKELDKEGESNEILYTKDQENELLDVYDDIIEESDGVIVKIEQKDNYEIINVLLQDEFEYLDANVKQVLVDDWGNEIENNTRSRLFGTPAKDFKYVYFINSNGEYLADTNHFDKKWKVKE